MAVYYCDRFSQREGLKPAYEHGGDWPSNGGDPDGAEEGMLRVVRGGFWYTYPRECRSAHRFWRLPTDGNFSLGFRPVRSAR